MPELPEVETSRRGISPHIKGQIIHKITVRNKNLRWPIPVSEIKKLEGLKLLDVSRRGKYLKLVTSDGFMLVHLGMSGSLRIVTERTPLEKHDHVDVLFKNKKVLRFNDPRRFGSWLFQKELNEDHPLLEKLGPEPLSEDFSGEYLFKRSRKKAQNIKSFIMDSHVVVGVGNIYACESLFKSRINPNKPSGKVSQKAYLLLTEEIKTTLTQAIEQGGTTLKDFVDSDGKPGYFKQELQVYGREGENCNHCGSLIKNKKIAQRSTFYCAKCQK